MLYFIFSALIVCADQVFKYWVSARQAAGELPINIIGLIQITHQKNTGAAFNLFAESNARWPLVAIGGVCIIALIVVIVLYRGSVIGRIGLAAVLGGAIGNLIDRAVTGGVVDMLEPLFVNFAIFNIADCFITVGGIVFLLSFIFGPGLKKRQVIQSEPETRPQGKPTAAAGSGPIFNGTEKDLSETKILEEYDLERLLSEYNGDGKED